MLMLPNSLVAALSTAALLTSVAARVTAEVPPIPKVTHVPTTAGSVPYGSTDANVPNLASFGYVQEEYFISSTLAGVPYTTRILVRRPAEPAMFSGIVIAESIRSTATRSMWGLNAYLMRSGHAYVEIGSNLTGINNLVKPSDAARYATINLTHPSYPLLFGHINEIAAQAGLLLKTNPSGGPFAGFQVRRVLLAGCSEQGVFVRMYMRDSHWLYRTADGRSIYDGYFPACVGDWPVVVRWDDGTDVENFTSPTVDVPVINFTTQQEPESYPQDGRLYRRPDNDAFPGDRYRLYEVAGMQHGFGAGTGGTTTCVGVPKQASRFPGVHVANNALDKLVRWVDRGITPARAERVAPPLADRLSTDGPGGPILNDEHGVAIGGVRTTYVDVPIARFELCNVGVSPATPVGFSLGGYEVPFSPEKLRELYRRPLEYVRRVNRRLNELIRDGWYLREDADEIRARALETAAEWERDGVF